MDIHTYFFKYNQISKVEILYILKKYVRMSMRRKSIVIKSFLRKSFFAYAHTYAMHIYLSTYARIFVNVCTYICLRMHIYLFTYARIFVNVCTYICLRMHVYLSTCARIFV